MRQLEFDGTTVEVPEEDVQCAACQITVEYFLMAWGKL